LGFVYDVAGDASLKIFGSYGLYFDVMKLYTAAASFGGSKNVAAFYTLDSYEWDTIGENGIYPGTLLRTIDYRAVSLDVVDPAIKPMSQREISLGVEKQLRENLSATAPGPSGNTGASISAWTSGSGTDGWEGCLTPGAG
ncbi:MAG: TonB-dependent receptor plug, partial [Candidatus Aminicenantes bacterium]|nr:TonB-dependent receptor plug [Candidatus Aminicenantes bacterium]